MSNHCQPIKIVAGGTAPLIGRIYNTDGDVMSTADVDSATINYIDTQDSDDTGTEITLNSSEENYLYDTLQTDSFWTDNVDSTGFNFIYMLSGVLDKYNTNYWVEVSITETSGNVVKFGWYVQTFGR